MEMKSVGLLLTLELSKKGYPFGLKTLPTKLLRYKTKKEPPSNCISLALKKRRGNFILFNVTGEHWETMERVS